MGITPAQKHETRIDFKKVTEVSFLKRTPVWNDMFGVLVGRLEFNSIGKMLAYTDSNQPDWSKMVIRQALIELSRYPSEVFEQFKLIFECEGDQIELLGSTLEEVIWHSRVDDEVNYYSVEQEFQFQEKHIEQPYQGLTKLTDDKSMNTS